MVMKGILPLWRKIVDKGGQRLFPLRPARILVLLGLALGSYYFITHDPLYQRPAVQVLPPAPVVLLPAVESPVGSSTLPGSEGESPAAPSLSANPSSGRPLTFSRPLEGPVIRPFGFTYDPVYEDYRFHPGVDLKAPEGSPVKALAGGVVQQIDYSQDWNYRIILDHGEGRQSLYAHLREIQVAKGDKVEAGEVIGFLGLPGKAEPGEIHLHLEFRENGQPVEPPLP